MRMALASYGQNASFASLDILTGRRARDWTWNAPVQLAMHRLGWETRLIEDFDYKKFSIMGTRWLVRQYGVDWTDREGRHTNLKFQQLAARQLMKIPGAITNRRATFTDLQRLWRQGWIVVPTVNAAALSGREGYVGHVVVLTNLTAKAITIHDPGLPPKQNRSVPQASFKRAFTGTIKAWRPT